MFGAFITSSKFNATFIDRFITFLFIIVLHRDQRRPGAGAGSSSCVRTPRSQMPTHGLEDPELRRMDPKLLDYINAM